MSELRSLHVILADLALVRPKLVLTKGDDYFRIEDLTRWARRDLISGTEEERATLGKAAYRWEEDGRGKMVVWMETEKGRQPIFSEVGSEIVVREEA